MYDDIEYDLGAIGPPPKTVRGCVLVDKRLYAKQQLVIEAAKAVCDTDETRWVVGLTKTHTEWWRRLRALNTTVAALAEEETQ